MKPGRLLLPLFAALLVFLPVTTPAQSPAVAVPIEVLHAIAVDFDRGLSPLYCYFGARIDRPSLRVEVDSVTIVSAAPDCAGIGVGFVLRTTDRLLLAQALRGVIEGNPRFLVVSAFYQTEDIEDRGSWVHAARPLSIIRGAQTSLAQGGS